MTFMQFIRAFKRYIWVLIAIVTASGALCAVVVFTVVPNSYKASTQVSMSPQATSSDLGTLLAIAGSKETKTGVASKIQVDSGSFEVEAKAEMNSHVITIEVAGTNAISVASLANGIAESTVSQAEKANLGVATQLEKATVPQTASGPNRLIDIVAACFAALFIGAALICLRVWPEDEPSNNRVRGCGIQGKQFR